MRYSAVSEQAANEAGLAPVDIRLCSPPRASRAAGMCLSGIWRLGRRHHSAVGPVDRPGSRGYLSRREDRHDRRRMFLALTASGERVLAGLTVAHSRELRRVAPLLHSLLSRRGTSEIRGRM